MVIILHENMDLLVQLHRKLEKVFPNEAVVPFQEVMAAIEYIKGNVPTAVYSEVGNDGAVLIYQLRKREIDCYCAYISDSKEYIKKPWIHIGKSVASDYFDNEVTEDKMREAYEQWYLGKRRRLV